MFLVFGGQHSTSLRLCIVLLEAINTFLCFSAVGQMVVAKALSRHYADMMLFGQSIVYHEHCVLVSRELKDKRLEGEYLEILSGLYLSLNTEK